MSSKNLVDVFVDLKTNVFELFDTFEFFEDLQSFSQIGSLTVKVWGAKNLSTKLCNSFCEIQLVNDIVRTKIMESTICPHWNQLFKFKLKDTTSLLEITVYHEKSSRKQKILGKLTIPLLQIRNNQRIWFTLKNKNLKKSLSAQILLEFNLKFNPIKAYLITIFTRKEQKYLDNSSKIKFNGAHFIRNVIRFKHIWMWCIEWTQFAQSCLEWHCPRRSIVALIYVLTFIYYFEWYLVPLAVVVILLINYATILFGNLNPQVMEEESVEESETFLSDLFSTDENNNEKDYESRFYQSLHQMVVFGFRTTLEHSSIFDRIENIMDFTVPFLSWVSIHWLASIALILYFIPIRIFIMFLVVNEFTKKFRNGQAANPLDNSEVMHLLSRVPDMEEKTILL